MSSSEPMNPSDTEAEEGRSPFSFVSESLKEGNVLKFRAYDQPGGNPMTYSKAVSLALRLNHSFLPEFLRILKGAPFDAFFFETPPVKRSTLQIQPFEFVLVDSPALARVSDHPDPTTFSEYLSEATAKGERVASFTSLGRYEQCKATPYKMFFFKADIACTLLTLFRDATLVCPCQTVEDPKSFTHLARFIRRAPEDQQLELFRHAASLIQKSLDSSPSQKFWFSTSGLGVYWLHLRIDMQPKYYTWGEYKYQ